MVTELDLILTDLHVPCNSAGAVRMQQTPGHPVDIHGHCHAPHVPPPSTRTANYDIPPSSTVVAGMSVTHGWRLLPRQTSRPSELSTITNAYHHFFPEKTLRPCRSALSWSSGTTPTRYRMLQSTNHLETKFVKYSMLGKKITKTKYNASRKQTPSKSLAKSIKSVAPTD